MRAIIGALMASMLLTSCTLNIGTVDRNEPGSSSETAVVDVSTEEAGANYLDIVNEVNCISKEIREYEDDNYVGNGSISIDSLGGLKPYYSRLSVAREEAVRNLLASKWPSTVAPEIEKLARDWSSFARVELSISRAPDVAVWNQLITKASEFNFESNPSFIRSLLGVGTAEETDDCGVQGAQSSQDEQSTSSGVEIAGNGAAPIEYWISGVPMAQPFCDGTFISIVMGASAEGVIAGLDAFSGAQYLRTDITCASLNPQFVSGRFKGEPVYVVFYGPFTNRFDAQGQCLDLGLTTKSQCYVAPLTNFESDRNVRFGPKSK
jgi:hypothetical protein